MDQPKLKIVRYIPLEYLKEMIDYMRSQKVEIDGIDYVSLEDIKDALDYPFVKRKLKGEQK